MNGPPGFFLGYFTPPTLARVRLALRLDDFAGLDAASADPDALVAALHLGFDRVQVDVPAPTSDVVRVGNVVAELRLLAANFTNLCHDVRFLSLDD